jgi:hypothetical protein
MIPTTCSGASAATASLNRFPALLVFIVNWGAAQIRVILYASLLQRQGQLAGRLITGLRILGVPPVSGLDVDASRYGTDNVG